MIPNDPFDIPLNKEQTRQKNMALLVYVLQACTFLVGITYLVAVIISYINKEDMTDSLFASHNRWQIRTFWFSVLWAVIGSILTVIVIGWLILLLNSVWVIYRIAKGWIRLNSGISMYGAAA